jgi:hypothetical protein
MHYFRPNIGVTYLYLISRELISYAHQKAAYKAAFWWAVKFLFPIIL